MRRALLLMILCGCAHLPPVGEAGLDGLSGRWVGTLAYTDYQPPHGRVVLPTTLEVSRVDGELRFAFVFDDGPGKTVRSAERFVAEADGARWGDETQARLERPLFRTVARAPGRWVLEVEGSDDDAPATLRETFEVSGDRFSLLKEVKPHTTTTFTFRHRYDFTRVK